MLLFIFVLFILENLSRKKAKYHLNSSGGFKKKEKIRLKKEKNFFAFLFCFIIFFISFVFPFSQMLYWTILYPDNFVDLDILKLLYNTLYLVILSSVTLIVLSFISNYGGRVTNSKSLNTLTTLSISGYAIPGVILALAFITFVAWFDDNLIKVFGFESIKKISESLDVKTIEGASSLPSILSTAGADDCDILIAVTKSSSLSFTLD